MKTINKSFLKEGKGEPVISARMGPNSERCPCPFSLWPLPLGLRAGKERNKRKK
jgi:hypothetical protein